VDETYVKVAGRWVYLYRAVDQFGQVVCHERGRWCRCWATGCGAV